MPSLPLKLRLISTGILELILAHRGVKQTGSLIRRFVDQNYMPLDI